MQGAKEIEEGNECIIRSTIGFKVSVSTVLWRYFLAALSASYRPSLRVKKGKKKKKKRNSILGS